MFLFLLKPCSIRDHCSSSMTWCRTSRKCCKALMKTSLWGSYQNQKAQIPFLLQTQAPVWVNKVAYFFFFNFALSVLCHCSLATKLGSSRAHHYFPFFALRLVSCTIERIGEEQSGRTRKYFPFSSFWRPVLSCILLHRVLSYYPFNSQWK